ASVINQFEEVVNGGPVTVNGSTYNTIEEYIENIVAANETNTTLIDNNDGTYTYTSEDGTVTVVDVPASVINQFEEVVNGGPVTVNGNTYTSIEEYIENIVAANETNTTLIDNNDGTYTYTSEDGTVTVVDVPASVINQFEEVVNGGPVTVNGNTYTSIEEYIENIVAANETNTTLIDNNDGTYTYTSEDGTVTVVDVPASVINQFEEVVNGGPVTVNGNTYSTIEEYIENIVAVTAANGLHIDGTNGDVVLGGTLTEPTTIITDATNTLAIEGLVEETDTDLVDIAVVDKTTGVLRTLSVDELATEPWNIQGTTGKAFDNAQNIYQMGSVAIKKDEAHAGVSLDVEGAVRGGSGNVGTVGVNSGAFGTNNVVSGDNGFAIGANNIVAGNHGFAAGLNNEIIPPSNQTIYGNIAMGNSNKSNGEDYSIALGQGNEVLGNAAAIGSSNSITRDGYFSTALGEFNTIDATWGFAVGYLNTVEQDYGVAIGGENLANAENSFALGKGIITGSSHDFVLGRYNAITTGNPSSLNWVTTEPLFQVGSGTDDANRANSLTLLKNGNLGLANEAIAPTERLDVGSGNVRVRDINTNIGDTGTDKVVVADADGVLKTVDVADLASDPLNIYNSDGLLTGTETIRNLGLNGKTLRFNGTDRRTHWDAAGRIHQTATNTAVDAAMGFHNGGSSLWVQQWNASTSSITATGSSTELLLSTHATADAAPIRFSTNPGGNDAALTQTRMTISGEGEIQLHEYPNTRDDSGTTAVENILYTDEDGNMLSADISALALQSAHYRATSQNTGKEWIGGEPVFEVVGDITLATNSNVVDLSGSDIPTGATVIGVRFISKTTGSISTNIIEYDQVNRTLILGTAGSMTTLHPAGDYYIIVEYTVVP
ncbi:hypothetical protein, partial [Sphingobacterium alkalisoli]